MLKQTNLIVLKPDLCIGRPLKRGWKPLFITEEAQMPLWGGILPVAFYFYTFIKYRGPILRVTSPALGSDDLSLDQSGMSIQILPKPNVVT